MKKNSANATNEWSNIFNEFDSKWLWQAIGSNESEIWNNLFSYVLEKFELRLTSDLVCRMDPWCPANSVLWHTFFFISSSNIKGIIYAILTSVSLFLQHVNKFDRSKKCPSNHQFSIFPFVLSSISSRISTRNISISWKIIYERFWLGEIFAKIEIKFSENIHNVNYPRKNTVGCCENKSHTKNNQIRCFKNHKSDFENHHVISTIKSIVMWIYSATCW